MVGQGLEGAIPQSHLALAARLVGRHRLRCLGVAAAMG